MPRVPVYITWTDAEQYRRLCLGDLALQAVGDVFSFSFGDAWMLGRRVARQNYPQYYRYRRRYSCTPHAANLQ